MSKQAPHIDVIVSKTGETTVQSHGFTGSSCMKATEFVESALGPVVSNMKTAEYYQAEEPVKQAVGLGEVDQ